MADKEKPEPTPAKVAPMWIVTFTDLASLLLTFFILILTFSSSEKNKLEKAQGSLTGAFGIHTDKKRSQRDIDNSLTAADRERDAYGVADEFMRSDQVNDLKKKAQDRGIFNVKIDDSTEGKRIRLVPSNGDEIFGLLDEELTIEAEALLKEVATMFRSLPYRVVVETHVDNRTWRIKRGVTAMSWTLDRGLAAAKILESVGIPPERISVSPKGDLEPLSPNNKGPDARYRNRRLEILMISDTSDPLYSSYQPEGAKRG